MTKGLALALVILAMMTGCFRSTPWRATYLDQGVGRLTQDDVTGKLGPPTSERQLSNKDSVWLYRYTDVVVGPHGGGSVCTEYILTFTPQSVLKKWNRQGC